MTHAESLVRKMYEDYTSGLSLAAVGRLYGRRCHGGVRDIFERRKLKLRSDPRWTSAKHLPNGCYAPLVPHTAKQITEIIRRETRLRVPVELKQEWRHWSLEQRAKLIARLRKKFKSIEDRPALPFSSNVEPFGYGSPRAWEILKRENAGLSSWFWKVKIDLKSQGVIWNDTLWFWSHQTGYQHGPWNKKEGRPALHRVIYEQVHGCRLKPADIIRYADGNPNNLDPSNLVYATRNDVCRENQAASLSKKSRAITAALLNRSQRKGSDHDTDTLSQLQRRKRKRSRSR